MAYYPPTGFHFVVHFELPGLLGTGNDVRFQEVSGLSASIETEPLKEGGENRFTHTLPLRTSYEKLVLKRGMLTDSKLIAWMKDAIDNFKFSPITINVMLLDENHLPVTNWSFVNAWPEKWSVSNLNAQENSLVIETIELSYNYFKKN